MAICRDAIMHSVMVAWTYSRKVKLAISCLNTVCFLAVHSQPNVDAAVLYYLSSTEPSICKCWNSCCWLPCELVRKSFSAESMLQRSGCEFRVWNELSLRFVMICKYGEQHLVDNIIVVG